MAADKKPTPEPAAGVNVTEMPGDKKPVRRTFSGPRNAAAKLRVAMERGAYAELIAHAKASLEMEVCGVLAGHVCEDDEGLFVNVEAAIRGTAASEGSVHVTFTQETWNAIHKTLERDYPKLKIVGWYHTHPGFGVEFSEMDLFIQRNFFSGPTHLALVTDPLSGATAICINTPDGIQYLDRFWVDGREQTCRVPARKDQKTGAAAPAAAADDSDKLRALEERVSQLVQASDDMRAFHYRFMMVCGFVFCAAILMVAGYSIYSQWGERLEPPRVNSFAPVPVQIGDKTVMLGVGIVSWQVPPELDAILLQAALAEREQAAKAAAATNVTVLSSTNSSSTNAP